MSSKLFNVLFLLLGILSIGGNFAHIGNADSQIEISRSKIDSENSCVQIVEIFEKKELIFATLAPLKILEITSETCIFHSNFSIDRLTYYFATLLV